MSVTTTHPRSRLIPSRRLMATIGAACILLSSVTGLMATVQASAADHTIVLDRHHTDAVSVRYADDNLVLKTRADLDTGAGQVLEPENVLFHVTDDLQDTVPDIPTFSFLGEPGTPIWKIPQTYQPGVLWAGWETESLPRGVFAGDTVKIQLQDVTGPGNVELYLNDVEGPRRVLSATDASLRTITENVGAHTHANWVFTAPGVYTFTFTAHADRVGGGVAQSPPQTYTFLVGSDTPAPTEPKPTEPVPTEPNPTEPAPTEPGPAEPAPTEPAPTEPAPTPSADPTPLPTTPVPTPSQPPAPAPSAPPEAPTPPDPTVAPEGTLPAPDAATLTEESRGGVAVSAASVAPGGQVTVTIAASHASHWVSPWLLSTPADLGWKQANAEGAFVVAVPPNTATGKHQLVVRDRDGGLIGWADLEVVAASQAAEPCVATPQTNTVQPGTVDVATDGHFDFGPVKEGGTVLAMVKDDRSAPAKWVDPKSLVFHLTDAAAAQAPGGQFDFLGGGQVWQIPLTQQSGVPWLGWNTQHPSIAGKVQGPITLTLDNLEGPGELAVYSMNSWGQLGSEYFGTVSSFPRSTDIEVGASGVHVHGIWAFTQPGTYYANLTFSGTVDGERASASSTLTFFVGPGDPRSAAREQTTTNYVGRTADGADCQVALAPTGRLDSEGTADLMSLAGASMIVGLAFLGASALGRPRTARSRTS